MNRCIEWFKWEWMIYNSDHVILFIKSDQMGFSEKKALALEKLAALEDEKQLDEILVLIERLNADGQKMVYHLSKHAEEISRQYHETMKKLAE